MRERLGRRLCLAGAALLLGLCLHAPVFGQSYATSIPPMVSNPPPLDPEGETVVPDDVTFRNACLSLIPALRKNIRLDQSLTTRSKQWGRVLRIDFSMLAGQPAAASQSVNRMVFWHGADGMPFILIAVGQRISPLPELP